MKLSELEKIINQELNIAQIKDYAPNGLQVEGRDSVTRIVTGVTASQALIDAAIELNADAILVHHGYFWKGEVPQIKGIKKARLKALLENDISLLGYHLPLDIHPTLGNNVQLAALWDINNIAPLDPLVRPSIALSGEFVIPLSAQDLCARIHQTLDRVPFHCGDNAPLMIKKIGWCSGGAQDYLELAAEQGMDAYVTGEVSERTVHIAREMGIHFFAAGHHATERYGIKALGEWLARHYDLDVRFIDIDNPI